MFGLFKKKTEKQKLEEKYQRLIKEAYDLSTVNRMQSDLKSAEAQDVLKEIELLQE